MKLPKTAYIRVDKESDEEWLATGTTLNEHAEIGQKRKVGIYKLQKIVEVTTEVRATKGKGSEVLK